MFKIAITTSSFGKHDKRPLDLLKDEGLDISLNPYGRKLAKRELIEICKDTIGIVAGTEALNRDIMEQLKGLRVISRCGVGLDNVDLEAARESGIKVFNTPDSPTIAVAELTVALMLNLLRKVNTADHDLKSGRWEKKMGNLVCGKRVGIIGFGRIGRKIAEILKSLNCKIKYTDPFTEDDIMGFEKLPLERLLSWADIVSLHASAGGEIIGQKEIQIMRKGAWLLNMSRGGSVNEKALYHAIDSGYLSGAALDVFEK